MGKTLAFALPVIEKLLAGDASGGGGAARRPVRVLVMAPTRELAKQVAADFELTAPQLRTTTIYGGSPYR
jgi:ATP-dependent RNA helicase DDX21